MFLRCPACKVKYAVADGAIGEDGRMVRCAQCGNQWLAKPENDKQPATDEEQTTQISTENIEHDNSSATLNSAETNENENNSSADSSGDNTGQENLENQEEESSDITEKTADSASAGDNLSDDNILEDIELEAIEQKLQPAANNNSSKLWIGLFVALLFVASILTIMLYRESLASPLAPIYKLLGFYPTDGVMLADVRLDILPSRRKKRFALNCTIVNNAKQPRYIPNMQIKIVSEHGIVLAEDDDFLDLNKKQLSAGEKIDCGRPTFTSPSKSAAKLIINIGSPLELKLRNDRVKKDTE